MQVAADGVPGGVVPSIDRSYEFYRIWSGIQASAARSLWAAVLADPRVARDRWREALTEAVGLQFIYCKPNAEGKEYNDHDLFGDGLIWSAHAACCCTLLHAAACDVFGSSLI